MFIYLLPEMKAAGVQALREASANNLDDEETIKAIYFAMEAVRAIAEMGPCVEGAVH